MKKLFALFTIATLVWGCSKSDVAVPTSYTLMGYNSLMTRTAFGTPDYEDESIPFLWSADDMIWLNGQKSEELDEGGSSAIFTVQSEPQNDDAVYYNMMAIQEDSEPSIAIVPTQQSVAQSLGLNGDFGYATVQDGSFRLDHATSYIWFNIEALPSGYTLKSIRLNAGDAIVAGQAQWDGSAFGAVRNGRSIIDLAVNRESVSGAEVAMVVLPTVINSATITYELSNGDDTKYYEQTLGANTLTAGATSRITVDLASVAEEDLKDYVLRVLTFEDNHAMFAPYSFTAPSHETDPTTETVTIDVDMWSDLIVDKDKQYYSASFIYGYCDYMSGLMVDTNYKWGDEGNTNLVQNGFKANYDYKDFAGGGGHVISKYVGISAETVNGATDAYKYQLSIPVSQAHSGENYAIGFHPAPQNASEAQLPMIEFSDDTARVVDHMWVTNTSVALWAMTYGSGFSAAFGGDDYLIIDAIGYNGTTKTGTLSFNLAQGSSIVNDWQKWDLSGLGPVTKVLFRMREAQLNGGWYCTPLYVAIDDIAVRFE